MEQEMSLIKQDILAVAIQEARQAKKERLELEKQKRIEASRQERENYITNLNNLPDELIRQYLEKQESMTPSQIDVVLNDKPSKIKILRMITKYLEKQRMILYVLCRARILIFLPGSLSFYFLRHSPMIQFVIQFVPALLLASLFVVYGAYNKIIEEGGMVSTILKKLEGSDYSSDHKGQFWNIKQVSRVISCLKQNIANLENPEQKLIEQG